MKRLLPVRVMLPFVLGLLIIIPSPVVPEETGGAKNVKCYVCTSEDPGCDNNVATTGDTYVKECDEKADGCVTWFIQYEFVFGRFLTRSCVYSVVDSWCLLADNYYTAGFNYETTSEGPRTYREIIDCLKEYRPRSSFPGPDPVAKNAPPEYGMVAYRAHRGSLNNTVDLSNDTAWQYVHRSKEYEGFASKTPDQSEVYCHSCEADVPIEGFGKIIQQQVGGLGGNNMEAIPSCSNEKRVHCKKAYGCATLWQLKKEKGGTAITSRVWRGCWIPGDQRCLRRPSSIMYSGTGRTSFSPEPNFNIECRRVYAKSRASKHKDTVVWHGTRVIESQNLYDEYVKCRQDIRTGLDVKEELESLADSKNYLDINKKPEGDDFFAAVRYMFCGFVNDCNSKESESKYVTKIITTTTTTTTPPPPPPLPNSSPIPPLFPKKPPLPKIPSPPKRFNLTSYKNGPDYGAMGCNVKEENGGGGATSSLGASNAVLLLLTISSSVTFYFSL